MEPEDLLPCSLVPILNQMNPLHIFFVLDPFYYYPPIYA
jgi:hypothetical protein